ncbi:uncharacterized protein LOC135350763 [Halichondria panicea]|uniref:uncharacterized protein LOC135350763 n=1 Tax=Halichondria panicea TaxID=6063 RepID=UPI00312B30B0
MLLKERATFGLLVLATLTLCSVFSNANMISVTADRNCSESCRTLDMALQNIRSNSTLQLEPGTHTVRSSYNVSEITDLSIVGDLGNSLDVVIMCDDSFGLIFVNIQRLTITGVVIQNCGFTGFDRVSTLFDSIKLSIDIFFMPLFQFSSGIMLVDIQDLVMENTVIQENEGFGLVGINIIGNSRFSNVDFISNYPSNNSVCNFRVTLSTGGSGGGLFLLYHDYIEESKNLQAENSTLTIENGNIMNNYNCRRDPFTVLYNRLSRTLDSKFAVNTSIAGSGGVSVSLGQARYGVNTRFDHCTFINNSALYQNAGMNVYLYNVTQRSQVFIQNCIFQKNGGLLYNPQAFFPDNGLDPFGALGIAFFVPIPTDFRLTRNNSLQFQLDPNRVQIENCSFVDNIALSAGGLLIFSFTTANQYTNDVILIKDCVFRNNTGNFGSGLFITELSYSAFESRLSIIIDSIIIIGNQPLLSSFGTTTQFETYSATEISNVRVHFIGNNTFTQNDMTALSTRSAVLAMSGYVIFSHNSGVNGGGLHLERESYVVFINQTELVFENNSAIVVGGAIYVDFRTIRSSSYDCWLFIEDVDIYCEVSNSCPAPNNRFIIKYFGNKAPFGEAVYGSNLFDCPWRVNKSINIINITDIESYPNISNLNPQDLPVLFDPPFTIDNNVTINTFPLLLTTTPEQNSSAPTTTYKNVTVEPGQQFIIPLSAYDRIGQPVPLTVFSQIDDNDASATIGVSNRELLPGGDEEKFRNISIRVNGSVDRQYRVTITSNEVSLVATFTVFVTLKNCSAGFIYNETTMSCECEISLYLTGVMCNTNRSISFEVDDWIGIDERNFYIQAPCIRDFCEVRTSVPVVLLSEPDTQCRNHRSGLLCGGCANNYSRVLGGTECELCTNNDYLALIVLFAALGIILFVILALFNVTITDGFVNGFIFYANIFSVYTSTFLSVTEVRGGPPLAVISFLNLNLGIKSCFYKGMTELDLVGLNLIFPLYLMVILVAVALFGKYVTYEKVSNFYYKIHITHIFATLLYIFYASVTETCVAILAFVSITIDQQAEQIIRWGRDPNVMYGHEIHGVLVAVSVFLLVVLLPLPIILLVPKISYRIPYIRKYKPVIDAFIAPFTPNRTFWVSFRLLFRVLIYVISALGVSTIQLIIMSFCITSMTLLQAYLKPFANASRNVVDTFLMFNLTLFSIAAIVLFDKSLTQEYQVTIFMFIFMYIFSIMFLLILTHYVLKRFQFSNKPYTKVQKWMAAKMNEMADWFENPHCSFSKDEPAKENSNEVFPSVMNNAITHTSCEIFPATRFRESLLEDLPVRAKPKSTIPNSTAQSGTTTPRSTNYTTGTGADESSF